MQIASASEVQNAEKSAPSLKMPEKVAKTEVLAGQKRSGEEEVSGYKFDKDLNFF